MVADGRRAPDGTDMPTPPDASMPPHGGDLAHATARYGSPTDGWLDLSTGINPHPYPAPVVGADDLAALPDRAALDRLLATARQTYQIPPEATLFATPGSEIALRLLPTLMPDRPTAIVGPTYGSHYDAWVTTGRRITNVGRLDEITTDSANVVVTNPNNPDGRTFAAATLVDVAAACTRGGGALIVDEAFADLDPDISLAPLLDQTTAVVLRSFGKFYGLAGLRLGFVASSFHPADRLGDLLGDWPVSTTALSVGQAALSDETWRAETRRRLRADAARLRSLLEQRGLLVVGGCDLFVLAEHVKASALHVRLAETGIWTRAFPFRRDWLRFGLPGSDQDFDRLDRTLAAAADVI